MWSEWYITSLYSIYGKSYFFFLSPIYSLLWHTICKRLNIHDLCIADCSSYLLFFFIICFEGPQSGPRSASGAVISGAETWCKVLSVCCSWILSSFSFLHSDFSPLSFFPSPLLFFAQSWYVPEHVAELSCHGNIAR